jgi:predicted RNA-binding Zn-ribbon protein involved in translation (DUF1610 family)
MGPRLLMAGSEKFAFKLYPNLARICISCGNAVQVKDVAEDGKQGFTCARCVEKKIAASIERTRAFLGLP